MRLIYTSFPTTLTEQRTLQDLETLGKDLADAAGELKGRLARGDWSIGQPFYDDGVRRLAGTMDPLERAWFEAKLRMAAKWDDDQAEEEKRAAMEARLTNAAARWKARDGGAGQDEFGSGSCGSQEWTVDVPQRGRWTVFGSQGGSKDEPMEDVAAFVEEEEEDAAAYVDYF